MAQEKRDDAAGKEASKAGGKGDDYEFIPPDFDEDAFIHREMVSFRTTVILFLWGIVAALASWGAFAALGGAESGWLVGLLIAAAFGVSLKWLYPALKADIRHFQRREWLGTGALFFFTWLAFFLIAINPPISDFAPPRVDLHAAPYAQQAGGDVTVHLFVEDNVRVDAYTFQLLQGGDVLASEGDLEDLGRGHYTYTLEDAPPGTYVLQATATDGRGHGGEGSLEFAVSEGLLDYSAAGGGVLAGPADRIFVRLAERVDCVALDEQGQDDEPCIKPVCKSSRGRVTSNDPCIRTVRLELADGRGQVLLRYVKDENAWIGTTALAGWPTGNATFDVVAEMADQYDGSVRFDGGALRSGPHSVTVAGTPGDEVVAVPDDPLPPTRNVPGLGLPLLAAGLLAAAVALRRR